jgi:dCTP deaminase
MILPDWLWERWGERIITPWRDDRVNPSSVDLTLARHVRLQRYRGEEYPNTPARLVHHEGAPALLVLDGSDRHILTAPFMPGDSVLASTWEHLRVPRWLRLQGMLKSSLAREGMNHRTALYVDPGFVGHLTLELQFDRSGYLVPGHPVIQVEAQVVLPRKTYAQRSGNYMHQSHAVPNRNAGIAFIAVLASEDQP